MQDSSNIEPPILQTVNLSKKYFINGKATQALNEVNITVYAGQTLGIVGESGSGKSTLGKCILKLVEPTSGSIFFKGQDISNWHQKDLLCIRKSMQMIFQDPYASLNPRLTIAETLMEPLIIHQTCAKEHRKKRVLELLDLVGLNKMSYSKYPHEFSGGQRQRIGIARALAIEPEIIIADEAISALDVSIQAQIINLLIDLQKQFSLTYLFIAHDLAVVRHISDEVVVMNKGSIVEYGPSDQVYQEPQQEYTQSLIQAIPVPNPSLQRERWKI